MNYWLLLFFFDHSGNFISKQELLLSNKSMCEMVAAQYPAQVRDRQKVKTVCVSDDHHAGRKQDENVPMDF